MGSGLIQTEFGVYVIYKLHTHLYYSNTNLSAANTSASALTFNKVFRVALQPESGLNQRSRYVMEHLYTYFLFISLPSLSIL